MTPEGKVLAAVVRRLKARRAAGESIWWAKLHGNSMQKAGLPDLVVIEAGRTYWIELKRPGGKLSAIQEHVVGDMKRCGADVRVVSDPGQLFGEMPQASLA